MWRAWQEDDTIAPTGDFALGNKSTGLGHTGEIIAGGLTATSVDDQALAAAQIQEQFDAALVVSAVPGTMVLIGSSLLFLAPSYWSQVLQWAARPSFRGRGRCTNRDDALPAFRCL